ncbi:Forkhead box protein J3 [Mortierella sp. AD011]|nr:Forkhead box protein J3 [Mortierella sp. AD011]
MPIVFNNSAKNTEATPPTLETYSKPNTRSRRTLSTGSLHRLKKEVGASLQQNQHQEDHERDSSEGTEPDESTTPAALPLLLEKTQTQLEHTSLARRTNTARSSHPPLAPSSLWVSSSERRGNESEHDDESRIKRRRSMGSSDQSLSYAENDGRIKGVVCPLSPPSSQLASSALDALVSISNDDGDEQQSVVAPDGVAVKLETVSEGCEPSSETTSTTITPTPTTASTPQGRNISISGEDRAECAIEPDYTQRPPISYAGLIIQVLLESTKIKMTLADIYAAIMQKHPYYRHAASGWQASNSVRNSLSLNKAFAKVDRTPDEPGHGCFWALQDHVRDSSDPFPCRKRKAPQSDSTTATRSKGATLPKLDCVVESPSERSLSFGTPSFLDSAPSPAASEDAEDLKSPRRSGRARRPPRPKEAEDYIGLNTRQPSLINASLSTPPSSPAPYGQDREVTPVTAPARKRASSVKVEKIHSSTAINHPNASRDETPLSPATARKAVNDVDLASIPGVVTTQRIRRPPQNLAEFVSSEDFKAAPCGKRTLQPSTSSSSLNGTDMDASPREKKEAKRSKSESHISFSHSGKRASPIEADHQNTDPESQRENFDRSPSVPNLPATSRLSHLNPNAGPAIIPLSALSHSRRASRDFSGKKQRRDPSLANGRSKSLYSKRHSSHEVPTREQILERRRRDGKRESMVASDDDWSDSDFDFLRDEEENYRLMRIRVRKIQKTCGRWSLREVNDRYGDVLGDDDLDSEDEHSRAEGEKIKLLLDPSVINYGFDSCDSEYILDYHQGPLFNNVTWPEFSDVKEDSNNSNTNSNSNSNSPGNSNSSNPCNLSHPSIPSNSSNIGISGNETEITGTIVDDHVLESVADDTQVPDLTAEQVNIDPQVVAEVLSALTKSVVLGSELTPPIECIPNIQVPSSPLPLTTPNGCTDGKTRKQEADEWALFVGNCGPKMECNTGANRRNVDIESEARLKNISPLEHDLPDSEIEAVVAAVSSGVVVEASQIQMEGVIAEVAPVTAGIKEDIEVDDFIGWSLCE